jgi:hypothetical protein
MTQVTKSDYEEAQRNPAIRQDFLNAIDLEEAGEFVGKIQYLPFINQDNICMATYVSRLTFFGFDIKLSNEITLFVLKNAFNKSYEYFLSKLIDHEGQHARQYFKKGSAMLKLKRRIRKAKDNSEAVYLTTPSELPASANQFVNASKRGIPQKEQTLLEIGLCVQTSRLYQDAYYFDNPRDPLRNIRSVLCDSAGDNLVRKLLNLGGSA